VDISKYVIADDIEEHMMLIKIIWA
jgi:hypothetical protein